MKITIHNYEEYALDYLAGELQDEAYTNFCRFLAANPEIAKTLENLATLVPETELHGDFNAQSLKKELPATGEALSLACFDYLENNLTAAEQANFEKSILIFPEAQTELKALASTVLQPDLNVIFPYKRNLKRFAFPLFLNYTVKAVLATAAATIIYFGVQTSQYSVDINKELNQAVAINDSMPIPQINISNKKITLPYSKEQIKKIKSGRNSNSNVSSSNQNKETKLAELSQSVSSPTLENILTPKSANAILLNKNFAPKLSENIQQTALALSEITIEEAEYKSLSEIIVERFKKNVLRIDAASPINAMVLAESSINGIGKLTNSSIQLKSQKNSEGKPTYWAFEAGKFSIERHIKKNISE